MYSSFCLFKHQDLGVYYFSSLFFPFISDLLSALMEAFVEAVVRVWGYEVTMERDETTLMEESLRAEQAELEAKERERSMLLREKDRVLAVKEAGEKLVADFLEADDGKKNFDEKAMMDAIEALIGRDGGDGRNWGEFGGVYGGTINYLENTHYLDDEGTVLATIEGTNGNGE